MRTPLPPGPAAGNALITDESASWDAIGLGTITDFVQQASGPVDLDRSLVELTVTAAPLPVCPACAGSPAQVPRPRRLRPVAVRARGDGGSPAGMSGLRGVAGSSSPPTWTMPGPHVPAAPERGARGDQEAAGPGGGQQPGRVADARGHLGPAVAAAPARRAGDEARAEKDLMRRARLLAEAAVGFAGRPGDFGSALAESHDQAERSPAWPVTLIRDLGRAGQGTEAVTLSETLAVVDPARHGLFAGEAAIALAEAGLADDARAKIAEAALAYFQVALPLAQQAKDYKAIRNLSARIFRLTSPAGETVQRRQPRSRPSRSQRKGRR